MNIYTRWLLVVIAGFLCFSFTACDDALKLLNITYDPAAAGAPQYQFATPPVGVVVPYRNSISATVGPQHVGEFRSTVGTLEDRAFAEANINDIVTNAMVRELNYSGFVVYDERTRDDFVIVDGDIPELCKRILARHPDAVFAVGGNISRFWGESRSFFWSVEVKAEVRFMSYVIDLREARIILQQEVGGTREGAEQYVGSGRMKVLLQEALSDAVAKTLRNPAVVDYFQSVGNPAENTAE